MPTWKKNSLNLTPIELAALAHFQLSNIVYFDSALTKQEPSKQLSIIAANPVELIKLDQFDASALRTAKAKYSKKLADSSPPQPSQSHYPNGGLFGWINYEGDCVFGIYPEVLIYDHTQATWYENGNLSSQLDTQAPAPVIPEPIQPANSSMNMSQEEFESKVKKAQDYITAGDIYQVNLAWKAQFQLAQPIETAFGLYQILRQRSNAPMSAWLNLAEQEILSASPELFLKIQGKSIQTQPIKGTRPRSKDKAVDESLAQELLNSEKELSELTMITDLERNDLGQICQTGSVQVSELHRIEHFEQVHHLVSVVQGEIKEELDSLDAIAACIPGGSITGAPKKRAQEIIRELEPHQRGFYTGAIGYIGLNPDQEVAQFNLAIRSIQHDKKAHSFNYYAGAGIVADSDPQAEYEETLHKASGIKMSLEQWLA